MPSFEYTDDELPVVTKETAPSGWVYYEAGDWSFDDEELDDPEYSRASVLAWLAFHKYSQEVHGG